MAVYDDVSGELQRNVPVRYTNPVDAKDVSKDIASSLYRFRHMAHNFKAKSEIVGQVMLFRDIIKNRGTLELNPEGIKHESPVAYYRKAADGTLNANYFADTNLINNFVRNFGLLKPGGSSMLNFVKWNKGFENKKTGLRKNVVSFKPKDSSKLLKTIKSIFL